MAPAPTTRIRFHGVAAYEILTRDGLRILCDPFLDQNPGRGDASRPSSTMSTSSSSATPRSTISATPTRSPAKYGCPVVCGGEVKAWLMDRGIPAEQIRATTWGIRVKVAGIEIQPLECHHWSQIRLQDGSFISGVPMAFIVYADENLRFYHYGDTAIFSDLKLQAELYKPNVGCIGIANPQEILHLNPMPGRNADRRDEPLRGRARGAMARPRDRAALPLHHARRRQGRGRVHGASSRGQGARRRDRRRPTCCAPATGSSSTPAGKVVRPAKAA